MISQINRGTRQDKYKLSRHLNLRWRELAEQVVRNVVASILGIPLVNIGIFAMVCPTVLRRFS